MRVDGGGTPALITEREQQDWTRTVMRVAIDSGQVFYGEDAERKEAEDVGAISSRQMELLKLVIDNGLPVAEAERRLGYGQGSGAWIIRSAIMKGLVVKVGHGQYAWTAGASLAAPIAETNGREATDIMSEGRVETEAVLQQVEDTVKKVVENALRPLQERIDGLAQLVGELRSRVERQENVIDSLDASRAQLGKEIAEMCRQVAELRKSGSFGGNGIAELALRLLAKKEGISA